MGKRGRNQMTGRSIDDGTTKESPSKRKPIKPKAAAKNNSKRDVGGEPFEVKQREKRSRSLTTDGVKYGGGKDSASGDDDEYIEGLPVIESSFGPESRQLKPTQPQTAKLQPNEFCGKGEGGDEEGENNDTRSAKDHKKAETPWSFECYGSLSIEGGGIAFMDFHFDKEASLKNEYFKIKTFDLRGGDGDKGGTTGGDTGGGVGGQGGGGGGVAK